MLESQATSHVLMVRPVRFGGNLQTAGSNRFQRLIGSSELTAQTSAIREFDTLVAALERAEVAAYVFEDTVEPHTPDSIFPNNWASFHADGTVVLYPMLAKNRRLERRFDIIDALSAKHGFQVTRTVDLTYRESIEQFLEGTGSLVLDRVNRIAYACISPRTNPHVLEEFAQQLQYEIIAFNANDATGSAIYHTNVMMSVGRRFAALCTACIDVSKQRVVIDSLQKTGRTVIDLSCDQMLAFAGNILELQTRSGGFVVAMSSTAKAIFDQTQIATLQQLAGPILSSPIPTIESLGGGSVRCMLAEIHLPRKN